MIPFIFSFHICIFAKKITMAKRRPKRFKKSTRKLTKNRIYVKDWMERKPYDNFTPYDQYYTDIANEIWKILAKYDVFFKRQKLGKENECYRGRWYISILIQI